MSELPDNPQRLLDLHLGRLEPDEVEAVEAALASSPGLAACNQRLEQLLGELDAYVPPAAPIDLADRVMVRIASSQTLIPFPTEAASALPSGATRDLSGSPVLSLRELITIAACITVFVGIFVPGYYKAQAVSQRTHCRANQGQVYAGLSSYMQAYDGVLPYAGAIPDGSWLRVRTPGVVRASNTRHIYVAVRENYLTDPRVFLCPARPEGVAMRMDDYRMTRDFAEPANFTFSYQNSNGPKPISVQRLSNRMPILADMNPLFSRAPTHNLDPFGMENSHTHGVNAGQNVLYTDGHVGWVTRPTVGINDDNIYLAGTLQHYTGTELPQSETDSFLAP